MLNNSIPRRYALALFEIAREQQALEQFEQELELIITSIGASEEFSEFIDNQLVPAEAKKAVIDDMFTDKVSPTVIDFMKVVMDKRREVFLKQIYNEFVQYANEARNIKNAEVVSASELTPEQLQALTDKLSTMTGKNIKITHKIDPSIRGGLVVRIGDKVIDGSVTKRLELMKDSIINLAKFNC